LETYLVPEKIDNYSVEHTSPESPELTLLNTETQKREDSVMISGHLQGAILTMLSRMIKPENILEIGTYTGYSAICMAKGLSDGKLYTIDINDTLTPMVSHFISLAGLSDVIIQHVGDGRNYFLPSM